MQQHRSTFASSVAATTTMNTAAHSSNSHSSSSSSGLASGTTAATTTTETAVYLSPQVDKELERLVYHFLKTKGLTATLQSFITESKIVFDTNFVDQCVLNGLFKEAEQYIQHFLPFDPNTPRSPTGKVYFHLRKAFLFDAHDAKDKVLVQQILNDGLAAYKPFRIYQELAEIVSLPNFREHEKLRTHPQGTQESRQVAAMAIKTALLSDPSITPRLTVPSPAWKAIVDYIAANPQLPSDDVAMSNDDDFTLEFQPAPAAISPSITSPFNAALSMPSASTASFITAMPSLSMPGSALTSSMLSTSRATDSVNGSSMAKRKRVDEPLPQPPQQSQQISHITRILPSNTKKAICRVLFTNNGESIIAIDDDGHMQTWRFSIGQDMLNSSSNFTELQSPENPKYLQDRKRSMAPPFVVITHNDHYLIAGAGGTSVSLLQHNQKDSTQIAERGHIDLKDPIKTTEPGVVTWIEFHPKNNNLLGVGFSSGALGIFKFGKTTNKLIEMTTQPSTILGVVFHEEGKFIASFDRSSLIGIWYFLDISSEKPETAIAEPEFRFHPTPAIGENIVCMCFRPKSSVLAVAGQKAIAIYNVSHSPGINKQPDLRKVSSELGCNIRSFTFSKDGSYIHCCADKSLILLDGETLKEIARVPTVGQCRSVHSLPNEGSMQCVVGTNDGRVVVVRYSL